MAHTEAEYEALDEELFGEDVRQSPDGRIALNIRRIYAAVLDARKERDENKRLREAFDSLCDHDHRMWDGGHSVNDMFDYLNNAKEGP